MHHIDVEDTHWQQRFRTMQDRAANFQQISNRILGFKALTRTEVQQSRLH